MKTPPNSRVILYVKDLPVVAEFYQRLFGMELLPGASAGWMERASPAGGCALALRQAAESQKSGAAVKLAFAVADVDAFVRDAGNLGVKFGPVHRPEGFAFANAKDPAGNAISVSSRGL